MRMRGACYFAAAALAGALAFAPNGARAAGDAPTLRVTTAGAPQPVFTASNRCDGDDVPDVNARAIRDDAGETIVFALHDLNRALRGPDLDRLSISCAGAFAGHGDADPAAYDDAAWIASLWTADGRDVVALIHHEYHAADHPGRCISSSAMACWYNTVIEATSSDGARTFHKAPHPVVAAAPFRQDVDQTQHRGFFNPSNIVSYDGAWYFFASTTGWPGQDDGACLFRSRTPGDPASWRAFDGRAFTIAYRDPYASPAPATPKPCIIVQPFLSPVGSVVRYRPTGDFLAIWQAKGAVDGPLPTSGFYYATSRNLLDWSAPRLLTAGPTLYDDPCGSGGRLINYPSTLDPTATTRTFEDIGPRPWLYFASLRVDGCDVTSDRLLLRQRLTVAPNADPAMEVRK
jgi:hypothetical protein